MRSRFSSLALVFGVGVLSSVFFARTPAAGEDPKGAVGAYLYFPRGEIDNVPELLDTRTGAIYKKNNSNGWEIVVRAVGN